MSSSLTTPDENLSFERVKTSKEKMKERAVQRRNARRFKMSAEERVAYEEKKVNYRAAVSTRIAELADFIHITNKRFRTADNQPFWTTFLPATVQYEYEFRRFSPYTIEQLLTMYYELYNSFTLEETPHSLSDLRKYNEGLRSIHTAVKDAVNMKQWRDHLHQGHIFIEQDGSLVPAYTENMTDHETWVQEQERLARDLELAKQKTASYLEASKVKTGVSWKSLF